MLQSGSQKSPKSRRQRTTSLNQTAQKPAAESIIRTQHRTIYTAGRPPWYNTEGQKVEPFVIGEYRKCFLFCVYVFSGNLIGFPFIRDSFTSYLHKN